MRLDDLDDFQKAKQTGLKIGVFDIETSNLNADYGFVFCACIYDPINNVMHTFRIDDPRNPDKTSDKWVIRQLVKKLNEFDLVVGWYSSRFDFPFVNSRALYHKLKVPVRNFRRDLWMSSRAHLKLRSNSLAVVGEYLLGKSGKNRIKPDIWNKAHRGDKKALDYIVLHCELDVIDTAKVYKRMLPIIGKRLRKN